MLKELKPEQRAFFEGFREWVQAQPPERQLEIAAELRRQFLERLYLLYVDSIAEDLLDDVEVATADEMMGADIMPGEISHLFERT
jgi:hypothetical protein